MRLTKAEVGATILDVTIQRFYELVRSGILPPGVIVRLGRQLRVDEDALLAWITSGGQALAGGWRKEPEDTPSHRHPVRLPRSAKGSIP